MGILKDAAKLVKDLRPHLPDGFSVCELGDQWMSGRKDKLLAADWYRQLGCGRYVSIDGNGRGTMTHDLNVPLGPMKEFDIVTDFGTSEHVFDQAQVWRTLHHLTKPGGYLVIDRPENGYPGHCYYRVDKCLLEDVARANRYKVLHLSVVDTPRGRLVRAVFRRPETDALFVVPQQGRYLDSLVIG